VSDPNDELAERRATKGLFKIQIGSGPKAVVREGKVPLEAMPDPMATLRARAPRRRRPPRDDVSQ